MRDLFENFKLEISEWSKETFTLHCFLKGCVWFIREVVKREICKREVVKREKGEKYSRFDVLFGIRERREK